MITPTECSCHIPRDIENMLTVCMDCGVLLHKCRKCNAFYEKNGNNSVFICNHCKFSVERPPSPVPVTSSMITNDSIDDTLDEEESEPINVEQETFTTKPTESQIIHPRDSRIIALTMRVWLTLMIISMVIGYMVSFI